MGIAVKHRKKYISHKKRWDKQTILEEATLVKDYALKNKKEIRKIELKLQKIKTQAKNFNRDANIKNSEEARHFIEKLKNIGFLPKEAETLDEILDINIRNILERRLSNLVYRKKLAKTPKQARQFVVHRHIQVNGKIIDSPSHIVSLAEEETIEFIPKSPFANEEHPERKMVGELEEELEEQTKLAQLEEPKDSFEENESFREDEELDEVKE
jgi:small subunit ribosomal protein S4